MNSISLEATTRMLVISGKGILAADESLPTIQKRFKALGIESTEETRRAYRELLFTTGGIEKFISGVILFEETLRQKTAGGSSFVEVLTRKGIIPGIKVDKGTIGMPNSLQEKITAGRDGLRERLQEYVRLGARFTKWRAVITIGAAIPSRACMYVNAHDLALFAALSQEAGLVPIVEPEILMDGDHDIARCEEVTSAMLELVFDAIRAHHVMLDGMLLKPNMVLSGKQSAKQASPSEVADRTIRTLRRTVPAAVPGILFLSGGQTPELATEHLNIMNARGPHPWELSFSYARALQDPALKAWAGSASNAREAQYLFYQRAKCNGNARFGTYSKQMEKMAA
ncbi:MAG: fructose-bisphosphate aldolase [Nitrospirae bacterium GWD2_57_9]|nr:MAG: fructose-bisphosphate aldolase [Nitrospirae bacterium GWD2_57_9]OGW49814.1 MAG: fructose-bisphosphate aldolase [Nitrospirae bacterium GWC2_57_9]